jgi:hypothetical protein
MAERRSQREISAAKKVVRQGEMNEALASGRLIVRQMTPQERDENDVRRAAGQKARAAARKRRSA